MKKYEIEELANRARALVWKRRGEVWPSQAVGPLNCSNPVALCMLKDIKIERFEDLGASRFSKGRLAGIYDRNRNLITVNSSMPLEEQRFTIAHEIGHYKIHTHQTQFRDRPKFSIGEQPVKEKIEWEADYFATNFLMPEDLIREQFAIRFGSSTLRINDDWAWKLSNGDPRKILSADINSIDRELAAAKYCGFIGEKQFPSLAKTFQMSVSAMAIRLKELNLVLWP